MLGCYRDSTAFGIKEAHAAGADMILRRGLAFDDADPFLLRLGDAGEIFGGFLQLRFGDVLRHLDHHGRAVVGPVAVAEFMHLLGDVVRRQAGNARRFRMAVAVGKMAEHAGAHMRRAAVLDRRRHRRMLVREPVRRTESVVDLHLRQLHAGGRALGLQQLGAVRRGSPAAPQDRPSSGPIRRRTPPRAASQSQI